MVYELAIKSNGDIRIIWIKVPIGSEVILNNNSSNQIESATPVKHIPVDSIDLIVTGKE